MKEQVGSRADLRKGGFLGRAYLIEAAREADQQPSLRPRCEESPTDSREGQLDRRQLDSADSADHSGLGHSTCDHALDVGRLLDLEGQRATFAADPLPEVTMNQVFGNSFPTLSAASVYSNPCAKTILKPREAKSRSESSKSGGDCVCTSAVSTFSSFFCLL